MSTLSPFIADLRHELKIGGFEKATLSKPVVSSADEPTNLYLRPVILKTGEHIAVTFRYRSRDEVKNFTHEEFLIRLQSWMSSDFREAIFFTKTSEITLRANRKGEWKIFRREIQKGTAKETIQVQSNNREKHRMVDQKAPWLQALGITTSQGEVRSDAQDKWRQINKYLEVVAALLDSTPLSAGARVVDMGAGKGYLTFALADFLRSRYNYDIEVLGVELRDNLVELGNKVAAKSGLQNLRFVARDIAEVQKERIDMLIALHACDTVTDLAIFAGMQSKADLIVVAPCCHKQVRKEMEGTDAVKGILTYGIMKERQAEMLTDVIRSLLLQTEGYKTKVFEFIGVEHTPKNVMITAERRSPQAEKVQNAKQEIDTLKSTFGIKRHFLEELITPSRKLQD